MLYEVITVRASVGHHQGLVQDLEHRDDLQDQEGTGQVVDVGDRDVPDAFPNARPVDDSRLVELRVDSLEPGDVQEGRGPRALPGKGQDDEGNRPAGIGNRITSYNVCYTKLLRRRSRARSSSHKSRD